MLEVCAPGAQAQEVPSTYHAPSKGRPAIIAAAARILRGIVQIILTIALAAVIFMVGITGYCLINPAAGAHPHTITAAGCSAMRFDDCATLDPSNIDDLRGVTHHA